ncbi:MAG: hypothetical protein D6780_00885 [Candidatus Dadabacteria bacterium]|nr:MAG: hypothetical protein D6780_00885 [Candidatus Dadabacteria bacterium]
MYKFKYLVFIFLLLTFTSCQLDTEVVQGINQDKANKIAAVLIEHGISAKAFLKDKARSRFAVSVPRNQYQKVLLVIKNEGIDTKEDINILTLLQGGIFAPKQRELSNLRLDFVLAEKITDAIQAMPLVYNAKVMVRLNSVKEADKSSVVAVVLTYKDPPYLLSEEIKKVIKGIVPEVPLKNVVVKISKKGKIVGKVSQTREKLVPFLLFWRIPESQYNSLALVIIGLFLLSVVAGYFFGFLYFVRSTRKNSTKGQLTLTESDINKDISKLPRG